MRCLKRARTARRATRVCGAVLAGLAGAALITDPGIVGAVHGSLDGARSHVSRALDADTAQITAITAPTPIETHTLLVTRVARIDLDTTRP